MVGCSENFQTNFNDKLLVQYCTLLAGCFLGRQSETCYISLQKSNNGSV